MAARPSCATTKSERVELPHEQPNPPTEQVTQAKAKPRKKRQRYYRAVRRSTRSQSQNRDLERVEIILSESEREVEPPQLEENVEEPAVCGDKSLAEKMEYAVQLLETMSSQICIQDLRLYQGDNGSSNSSGKYKKLYFEFVKQNEALKKEIQELKLQAALAKLKGFEKGSNASMDWMGKFKEVLLVTSSSKASEKAVAATFRKNEPCSYSFSLLLSSNVSSANLSA